MWNRSKIDVENLNIEELVWYTSKYGMKENIEEDRLSDYLYTRKQKKAKKKVGFKQKGLKVANGIDTLARPKKQIKKNEKLNWDRPKKYPSKTVLRKLVGNALRPFMNFMKRLLRMIGLFWHPRLYQGGRK